MAKRHVPWRPVPAAFGVDGYVRRHERHLVHWKLFAEGDIGIVTVVHERMRRIDWLRGDFGS